MPSQPQMYNTTVEIQTCKPQRWNEGLTMAITLKRQLDDSEKGKILERQGRFCFATGHPIPENEVVQFDHILAFAHSGPSELDNIAPMCEMHNKQKGTMPLEDFRVSLRLKQFFTEGDG